jgi:hypothetical protein
MLRQKIYSTHCSTAAETKASNWPQVPFAALPQIVESMKKTQVAFQFLQCDKWFDIALSVNGKSL